MPLMKVEPDACKTKRKLSRGLTNWRNLINTRVVTEAMHLKSFELCHCCPCVWLGCRVSQVSLKLLDQLVNCLPEPPQIDLFSQNSKMIYFVSLCEKLTIVNHNIPLYWYFLKLYPPHYFWLILWTINPDVSNQTGFFLTCTNWCVSSMMGGGEMYRLKLFSVMYCNLIFL